MPEAQCKICQAPVAESLSMKDSRVFHYCDQCEFISLDPEFILSHSEEKSRYDLHENTIDNPGYVAMFEKFIKHAVEPYQVKTILDYGSGPGPVLVELLSRANYQVDNYDPYYAAKEFGENQQFDMVVSTETFEHFNEPLETIAAVVERLKPAAYLSLQTVFACKPEELEKWWYKNDETHVSFYSPKTFEYIADKFDLKIIWHNGKDTITLQKLV